MDEQIVEVASDDQRKLSSQLVETSLLLVDRAHFIEPRWNRRGNRLQQGSPCDSQISSASWQFGIVQYSLLVVRNIQLRLETSFFFSKRYLIFYSTVITLIIVLTHFYICLEGKRGYVRLHGSQ